MSLHPHVIAFVVAPSRGNYTHGTIRSLPRRLQPLFAVLVVPLLLLRRKWRLCL